MFNPLESAACLTEPERLSGVPGWIAHLPLAFALIDVLKPRNFVELGTHKGDSYCSFCQAVKQLDLPTKCFAVDTWGGDEHAGIYGPEALAELREHHDARYSEFSTLMQMTFDEARTQFADESIDLLHIDGYHTYEAVQHDWNTWRSTLSSRGVVLFHDTQVRERNFGVWQLWDEIRVGHPNFEFKHGHGLGVLAVGTDLPPKALEWFETAQRSDALENLFCALGTRFCLRNTLAEQQTHNQQQQAQLNELAGQLNRQASQLEEQATALLAQRDEAARLTEMLAQCDSQLGQQATELELCRQQLAVANHQLQAAEKRRADLERYYRQLRFELAEGVNHRLKRHGKLHALVKGMVRGSLRAIHHEPDRSENHQAR